MGQKYSIEGLTEASQEVGLGEMESIAFEQSLEAVAIPDESALQPMAWPDLSPAGRKYLDLGIEHRTLVMPCLELRKSGDSRYSERLGDMFVAEYAGFRGDDLLNVLCEFCHGGLG